jgi:hypothetical protein
MRTISKTKNKLDQIYPNDISGLAYFFLSRMLPHPVSH